MKRKNQTGKKFGKLVAAAMAAAFVFMSASTVSAGEKATEVGSATIGDLVDIIDGEGESAPVGTPVMAENGTVMYQCDIEDLDTGRTKTVYDLMQGGESAQAVNTNYRIDWTINPDRRHVSPEYTIEKGLCITGAVVVTPMSKEYKFGFMNDEGTAWYVPGKGAASFNYIIPEREQYRVFVQNDYKSTTLYSTGSFKYYNLK